MDACRCCSAAAPGHLPFAEIKAGDGRHASRPSRHIFDQLVYQHAMPWGPHTQRQMAAPHTPGSQLQPRERTRRNLEDLHAFVQERQLCAREGRSRDKCKGVLLASCLVCVCDNSMAHLVNSRWGTAVKMCGKTTILSPGQKSKTSTRTRTLVDRGLREAPAARVVIYHALYACQKVVRRVWRITLLTKKKEP